MFFLTGCSRADKPAIIFNQHPINDPKCDGYVKRISAKYKDILSDFNAAAPGIKNT